MELERAKIARQSFFQAREKVLNLLQARADRLSKRETQFDPTAKNADMVFKFIQTEKADLDALASFIDIATESIQTTSQWNQYLGNKFIENEEIITALMNPQLGEFYKEQLRFNATLPVNKKKAIKGYLTKLLTWVKANENCTRITEVKRFA